MTQITNFNWDHPDYLAIYQKRIERLRKLRDPERGADYVNACRVYYHDHPIDFIEDWGCTVDPRNAGTSKPMLMPFVLFPKQREFLQFIWDKWKGNESGILVKSRDCGASWLSMAWSVTMCLFHRGFTVGFGSATEDKVDSAGDPSSLFWKGRLFTRYLPREFRGNWDDRNKLHSSHMKLLFPHMESMVGGDAGDRIGRGGRTSVFFVDEYAHIQRPAIVDASLSATTNCRIEMSSVNGLANTFAERARSGKIARFDFSYLDDPRKTDLATREVKPWFRKFLNELDPTVKAQEYDCDFAASAEGVVIPQPWVQAAINAHVKLNIDVTGAKIAAYDVADRGKDKNCWGYRHGILLKHIVSWHGSETKDIGKSVERAFRLADQYDVDEWKYDGDGMGAGVRSDVNRITEDREAQPQRYKRTAAVHMFRGSGAVLNPEMICEGTDRTNEDFFENFKAQSWWSLRRKFNITWRAVNGDLKPGEYSTDDIISIAPDLLELNTVLAELSQPVWVWSKKGKMLIDKTPDGVMSPNHADTVMMMFSEGGGSWEFSDELFALI